MLTKKLIVLAAVVGVHGHAVMQDPEPRKYDQDIAGPIENAMEDVDADYNCNAFLCRGYQYEDNVDNVKEVKAGDLLDFHIDLIAGHHPGYANVSVIDLATNEAIGGPLRSWDNWPDSTSGPPRDDIDFNVTIPDTIASACDAGGKCAIQWYWYASGNEQTYESCLDFYVTA
ncbi:putative chitin binding protein [Eutypa lata UCREL1]|uniref:Putative chitin binding protein n=1 Tax=Eutypa lata (strain UCR-EL1) TaxID=1287681 RepID=M7T121_EUTLA|nr:putative chitin binding protein [Eutypa lata UCREL1]